MAVSKYGLQVGDLVEFDRIVYEHWAVYVGDSKIVHYKKVNEEGEIVHEDIDSYMNKCFVLFQRAKKKKMNRIVHESTIFSGKQVAERALNKVGMKGCNLLFKNCEHFAKWCKYDVPICEQVENKNGEVTCFGRHEYWRWDWRHNWASWRPSWSCSRCSCGWWYRCWCRTNCCWHSLGCYQHWKEKEEKIVIKVLGFILSTNSKIIPLLLIPCCFAYAMVCVKEFTCMGGLSLPLTICTLLVLYTLPWTLFGTYIISTLYVCLP